MCVTRGRARPSHTCQKLRPNVVMTRSTSADMAAIVALLASRATGPHLEELGAQNALSRARGAGVPGTGEKASSGSRSPVVSTRPNLSHAEARAVHGVIVIATNAVGFDHDGFDHSEQPYHRSLSGVNFTWLKDIPCEVRGARPSPG